MTDHTFIFKCSDECCICLTPLIYCRPYESPSSESHGLVQTNCNHMFHMSCLQKSMYFCEHKCPLCKEPICDMDNLFVHTIQKRLEDEMQSIMNQYGYMKENLYKNTVKKIKNKN